MPSLIQDLKAQLATQQEGNAEGESLLQRMRRRSHPRTFGTAFTEDQFGERGLSDMALNAIPGFGLGRQVGQVVQLTEAAEAYEKETATPEQVQMLERVSDFMAPPGDACRARRGVLSRAGVAWATPACGARCGILLRFAASVSAPQSEDSVRRRGGGLPSVRREPC